jgi:hypothetical protein
MAGKTPDNRFRLTIEFTNAAGHHVSKWYALPPDMAREMQQWEARVKEQHRKNYLENFKDIIREISADLQTQPQIQHLSRLHKIMQDMSVTAEQLDGWLASHNAPLDRNAHPAKIVVTDTGDIFRYWLKDGKLHRNNGPAVQKLYTGGETEEEYYSDGIRYRVRKTWPTGSFEEEHYDENGQLHNDNGPARIAYNAATGLTVKEWRKHGKPHRIGGPANDKTWENGDSDLEYYEEGVPHNSLGPSRVADLRSQDVYIVEYHDHGKKHREGKEPSYTFRKNGVETRKWYVDDKLMKEESPAQVRSIPGVTLIEPPQR